MRERKQGIDELLKNEKTSKLIYDRQIEGLLIDKSRDITREIDNLKRVLQTLELYLSNTYINYAAGQIEKKRFEYERNVFELGLQSVKKHVEKIENKLKVLDEKKVTPNKGFYFFEQTDKPLNQVALSFTDFLKKLEVIPVASLEFHQNRGDFSRWIRDVYGNIALADSVETLKERGEELRKQLRNQLLR